MRPAARREAGEYEYRPPQGESFADIEVRLSSFLDDLNRDHAGERVVVVAHDAVVLMMRAVIEKLTWDQTLAAEAEAGSVRNASITRFDGSSGRLVMDDYNSVDHLPTRPERPGRGLTTRRPSRAALEVPWRRPRCAGDPAAPARTARAGCRWPSRQRSSTARRSPPGRAWRPPA